ncbi:MAG: DUF4398 domain-containing protein [Halioglobus sp.]|nr:DUF4398 domain-containing protein [Halioglobus sp.]
MMKNIQSPLWRPAMALLAGSVLLLTQACSSTPRPEAEIAGASTALVSAQNQDAAQYAPVAMDRAKDKLRRAQKAMEQKDYNEARRLSEEARADAEYAQAATSNARAQSALKDMQASIDALRGEVSRGQAN